LAALIRSLKPVGLAGSPFRRLALHREIEYMLIRNITLIWVPAQMDLVQLRYFTRIAALRSFNRAAAQLAVAQPALTRQIKLLEEELGVQLLLRHSRGVEPTEAGEILAHGAETILRLADTVKSDVVGVSDISPLLIYKNCGENRSRPRPRRTSV
jgi:regulatory helix-turn-helix LysR family protein